MAGPQKVLVPRFSATRPRLWDSESYDEGLDRTHSDLVKYSVHDVDYERVLRILGEIASKATATLTLRYLSQGKITQQDLYIERETIREPGEIPESDTHFRRVAKPKMILVTKVF